jgi:hypothetical protein
MVVVTFSPEGASVTPPPGIAYPDMMPMPYVSAGGTAYLWRSAGTDLDGVWKGTLTVPRYAMDGTWTASAVLYDALGNTRVLSASDLDAAGFPHALAVASTPDTAGPVLTGLAMTPTAADVTTTYATFDISAYVHDSLSGCSTALVSLIPPDAVSGPFPVPLPGPMPGPLPASDSAGGSSGSAPEPGGILPELPPTVMPPEPYWGGTTALWLSDGTERSGKWRGTITLPQFAAAGDWTLQVTLFDAIGNTRQLSAADLALSGMPSTITVTSVPDDRPPYTWIDIRPYYVGSGLVLLSPGDVGGAGVADTFYRLDGGAPVSGTEVPVPSAGPHTIEYWSVDRAGNTEPGRSATFTVAPAGTLLTTKTTIGAAITRARLARAFTLSGALTPGQTGDRVRVEVKRPGSTRWVLASTRTVGTVTPAGTARWSYRFTPKMRGRFSFRARFTHDATRKGSTSRTVVVSVR